MSSKEFIMGMLLGCAVGAAAGLFLAPSEGVQTRRRVSSAAYTARHKVSDFAVEIQEKAVHAKERIKQAI